MIAILAIILPVVLAFISIAYQQGWLPQKYEVADVHPTKDPLLAKIFKTDDSSRKPRFIIRYEVPEYKSKGYKIIRIAFGQESLIGRECIWVGKVNDGTVQETVLMALPKNK